MYAKLDGWKWMEVDLGGGWSTAWLAGHMAKQKKLEEGGTVRQSRAEREKQEILLLL